MNSRILLRVVLSLLALVAICAVAVQHSDLSRLRSEQRKLIEQNAAATELPAESAPPKTSSTEPSADNRELLALRGEISRLQRRKQELQSAEDENRKLHVDLAARTNSAGLAFIPGYIRKGDAQNVGFGSPENTLQTFVWALKNQDWTNAMMAFGPHVQKNMPAAGPNSGFEGFIGFGVVTRTNLFDGASVLEVQIVPGLPNLTMVFRQFNGEWKIDGLQ